MTKIGRKMSKRAPEDQQHNITNSTSLTLQNNKTLNSETFQHPPPVFGGNTMDLTLLAVTRALDSLFVNLYRRSYPSFDNIAPSSLMLTIVSRHANIFVFALSSGTVVCL